MTRPTVTALALSASPGLIATNSALAADAQAADKPGPKKMPPMQGR